VSAEEEKYILTIEEVDQMHKVRLNSDDNDFIKNGDSYFINRFCLERMDDYPDAKIYYRLELYNLRLFRFSKTNPYYKGYVLYINLPIDYINKTIANYIINNYIPRFNDFCMKNLLLQLIDSIITLDPNYQYHLITNNNKQIRDYIKENYF
jgi:hypothetical protein